MRRCPVCREMAIRRPEVKTCGSKECLRFWKDMTRIERFKATQAAALGIELEILTPQGAMVIGNEEEEFDEEKEQRRVTSVTMPDALAKYFKPEPKPEDEVCKEHGKLMCAICGGLFK